MHAAGRVPAGDVLRHRPPQLVAAAAVAGVPFVIASGPPAFTLADGFVTNGNGAHAPGGYAASAALVAKLALTTFLLIVILGAASARTPRASRRSPSAWR
ncbi:MAG: hypothetical protein ACLFTL_09610 [Alphaproteobacteria bacterium]